MHQFIEYLVYAIPVGLLLDILGFILVVRYGHALFIHLGIGSPPSDRVKDGDIYIQLRGQGEDADNNRRRQKANAGVVLVVLGFSLQLLGSIAAISV